jgi:hypothetical protein
MFIALIIPKYPTLLSMCTPVFITENNLCAPSYLSKVAHCCIVHVDLEAKNDHDDGKYEFRRIEEKKTLMIPLLSPSVYQGELCILAMRNRGRCEQIFTLSVQP